LDNKEYTRDQVEIHLNNEEEDRTQNEDTFSWEPEEEDITQNEKAMKLSATTSKEEKKVELITPRFVHNVS
jgi:hypothetical protein